MSVDEWIGKQKTHTHSLAHACTHMYTHRGILFSLKKEGNCAICYNMDEPGGRYVKWNKLDRERQVLHGITALICGRNEERLVKGYKQTNKQKKGKV